MPWLKAARQNCQWGATVNVAVVIVAPHCAVNSPDG